MFDFRSRRFSPAITQPKIAVKQQIRLAALIR